MQRNSMRMPSPTARLCHTCYDSLSSRCVSPASPSHMVPRSIEGAECDAMRGFFKENIYPFAAYRCCAAIES